MLQTPLTTILEMPSAETMIACTRGHIAGLDGVCPGGCEPAFPIGASEPVIAIIPYKNPTKIENLALRMREAHNPNADMQHPVRVENGVILDGHHRIAAALLAGKRSLILQQVHDVLSEQERLYRQIRRDKFLPAGR